MKILKSILLKGEINKCNLTIGIPIRNEEESVEKCLMTILKSDFPKKTEIIICDNNCNDKSLDIISKLKIKSLNIVKESKQGKAFAMNRIIDESNSDYIIFCDADILVRKDTFKKIYKQLKNSDLHMVGIGLIDISKNNFFKWYYSKLAKVLNHEVRNNVMGGCFGINKKKISKFPAVLSTDFFLSAHYYYGNNKSMRYDHINAYYKRANTFGDILMKKIRNRLKYLQIKKDFPNLSRFPYEPSIGYKKLVNNLSLGTFSAFLLYSFFETIAFIFGTLVFYAKLKNTGYTWRKAKSTKLEDIDLSQLN